MKLTTQTSAGISTNLGVGDDKGENPRKTQTTATDTDGDNLIKGTSNVTYANTNENSASKTLATLGHGNITVGGVQLEKDGELTEAGKANGSPLIAINRDTQNTEKELWNSEQSQTVDATLDHRLLTPDGWSKIGEDWDITKEGAKAGFDKTVDVLDDTRIAVKELLGIESELSDEELNLQPIQVKFSTDANRFATQEHQFTEQEQEVLNQLELLRDQMNEADSGLHGEVNWEEVIKIAYTYCPAFDSACKANAGPEYAVNMINNHLADPKLDDLVNIQYLRDEAGHLQQRLDYAKATVGQAGNIAFAGSAVLGTSRGIVETLNSEIDSARTLIRETDRLTGHADNVDDVPPATSNLDNVPELKSINDVDGEMVGQPETALKLPDFETNGLHIKRPQDIPVGQEMIEEYIKMGVSYEKAIEYTKGAIASGADIPVTKIIEEPLYKVVPKGAEVSDYTIFWMSRSEVDRLMENPEQFAKNSGLPLQSNSLVYDVYKITPTQPAKVFESKIADTQQGVFKQEANATQILVPNRKQFTKPEKVFEFGGTE